jgi:hypothetical protein
MAAMSVMVLLMLCCVCYCCEPLLYVAVADCANACCAVERFAYCGVIVIDRLVAPYVGMLVAVAIEVVLWELAAVLLAHVAWHDGVLVDYFRFRPVLLVHERRCYESSAEEACGITHSTVSLG